MKGAKRMAAGFLTGILLLFFQGNVYAQEAGEMAVLPEPEIEENLIYDPPAAEKEKASPNLVLNKSAERNADGSVSITLEAYAAGKLVTTYIPSDIVLVLDQSGSMSLSFDGSYQNYGRLEALRSAAGNFIRSVGEDARKNNVDHRIAVVGFATDNYNTELLSVSGKQSVGYYNATASDYAASLQDTRTASGMNKLENAIRYLDASGATRTDLGMEMANKIFAHDSRPPGSGSGKRNRLVIVFSDGAPTINDDFSQNVADEAIMKSYQIHHNHGAEVYSIGIFRGANPEVTGSRDYYWSLSTLSNRFMNIVCDNYDRQNLGARVMPPDPWGYYEVYNVENLPGRKGNYYKVAKNSGELNEAFQEIISSIQGTEMEGTVVDSIQPQFEFPRLADGSPDLSSLTAMVGMADIREQVEINQEEQKITLNGVVLKPCDIDNPADIEAKKLTVRFRVNAKEDFLGGNNVFTNGEDSGMTITTDHGDNIFTPFPQPKVDIPLAGSLHAAGGERSIYQGDAAGFNVKDVFFGTKEHGIPFQINGKTFYLNGINNKYVKVTYAIRDEKGQLAGSYVVPAGQAAGAWEGDDLDRIVLEDSISYQMTVSIQAVSEGTYTETVTSTSVPFTIHVFRPTITAKDVSVYLSQNPDLNDGIANPVLWRCASDASAKKPDYEEPDLNYEYTYGSPGVTVSKEMHEFPKEVTDITVTGVTRLVKTGVTDAGESITDIYYLYGGNENADYAVILPANENYKTFTFRVFVSVPTLHFKDQSIYIGTQKPLADAYDAEKTSWSIAISQVQPPNLQQEYFIGDAAVPETVVTPAQKGDLPVRVKVYAGDGENKCDITDYLTFVRESCTECGHTEDSQVGNEQSCNYMIHVKPYLASICVKKEVMDLSESGSSGNDVFQIKVNATDGFYTDLLLKRNELQNFQVEAESTVTFSETVPMEYARDEILVYDSSGNDITAERLQGNQIVVHPRETLTVVLRSRFIHKGYFHAKDMMKFGKFQSK